ncbi:MAG: hypothetical protein WDN23_09060 [Edaphobacter sp.]
MTVNFPRFTSNPPQNYQQKPARKMRFSPKTPAKTHFHHKQKNLNIKI